MNVLHLEEEEEEAQCQESLILRKNLKICLCGKAVEFETYGRTEWHFGRCFPHHNVLLLVLHRTQSTKKRVVLPFLMHVLPQ